MGRHLLFWFAVGEWGEGEEEKEIGLACGLYKAKIKGREQALQLIREGKEKGLKRKKEIYVFNPIAL